MLDQRRVAAQPDEKREQLFTERYEDLLAWALSLTDRESAEDLVQDAFVQFVLGRTRLEEIENIDGYLRRMLGYMHCAKMSRSAQRLQTALSVADYDSLSLGWSAIEPSRRMQAAEELHQICTYACSRKESSRAGSVLILRFFFNYFPTEIASILNSSRHCIDEWQRLARREAKLFIDEPRRLRFVDTKTSVERSTVKYLQSECDLMHELRQVIFNSRQGDCLSRQQIEEAYLRGQGHPLTTAKIAHIVSCLACLDTVNDLLGLPLLAQRFNAESNEPKEPPQNTGGGTSGGGAEAVTKKFGRKLRQIREHKPQELRIAVNGAPLSSLKVSSDLSELNLNLAPDEPVEFVEVTSEQGVQLLFLSVNPTARQGEQWGWIELSDGRSLEACLDASGPILHVVYRDPQPAESYSTGESTNSTALSSPLFVVAGGNELDEQKVVNQPVVFHLRSWTRPLTEIFRAIFRRRIVAEDTRLPQDALVENTATTGPSLFSLSQSHYADRRYLCRLLSIAFVSALVICAFVLFNLRSSQNLTASILLEQAIAAQETSEAVPDTVKHRLINLEERRSAEGAIVARRQIEVWENHASGHRAQRLYDDSNRLIAGVWQTGNGSRTTYHHGSKPQLQPAPATPDTLLINLENIWQLEPSARAFSALIAEPGTAHIEEWSTTYVLRYDKERLIGASRLVKATLTLNKSDLRPIEQTLLVQRGSEIREYRFVEASFERVPVKAVVPTAFEIEPELTGGAGETGGPGDDWALRGLTSSRVPPSPGTSSPPVASAELEVDVAFLLNQAKADLNEQVALTRSAGGSLRVEGVVESQERKQEFLRALAPVINNPAVKIEIRTVEEAPQRASNTVAVSVPETEAINDTVAADEDLRRYFAKQDQHGPVDEAIRSYSSRTVNRAYRALFHAIELKRLVNRFANVDMLSVSPDARSKWLSMLNDHTTAFARENALLRAEIEPVFFAGTALQVTEEISIQSDADLARAVERLHKLTLSNNEAIRAALVISVHSSASGIKSAAFRQSLQRAGVLAEKIKRYQTTNK